MNLIINRKANQFTRVIEVFYDGTFSFDAKSPLESNDHTRINDLVIYHVFTFKYGGIKYEFKITRNDSNKHYCADTTYTALLHHRDNDACWFEGQEHLVYIWEPEFEVA